MKKLLIVLVALAWVAGYSAIANADGGFGQGISYPRSPHNFVDNYVGGALNAGYEVGETTGWNTRAEICRVCHVPHDHGRTTQRYGNGLLWNHAVSTASYTMYDKAWSATVGGTQSAQPDGTAKLCLGCHDGTVAIDTYDKYTSGEVFFSSGTYEADFQHPGATIPKVGDNLDLRGTHPISIVYDRAAGANNNELHDPEATDMGTSGKIKDVLDNGKVQCSSCHDVHDKEAVAATHLLRVTTKSPTPSGLCLVCHIK